MGKKFLRPKRYFPNFHALTLIALGLVGCDPIPQSKLSDEAKQRLNRYETALPAGYMLSYLQEPPAKPTGAKPAGAMARTLILVHGTPGDALGWADYLAPPLREDLTVVAVDRPGFAMSGPAGAVVSLQEQAAALEPFLPPKSGALPILLGHSLGGPVVLRAAVDYPERIGAVIVVAGSLDPDLEDVHFAQHIAKRWPFRLLLPRKLRNANTELISLEAELRSLEPLLNRITVPVFIVHGTKDDLVPYANVNYMLEHLTQAHVQVITLEGVNHFLPWNSKVALDQAIDAALDRLNTRP